MATGEWEQEELAFSLSGIRSGITVTAQTALLGAGGLCNSISMITANLA